MKLENQLVSNNIGEIFDSGLVDYKVRNYVMIMMMVTIIISILKKILLDQKRIKKKEAGILEGLQLFVLHNYVKGTFAISCLFMAEVNIINYIMKLLVRNHFDKLYLYNSPKRAYYKIS